MTINKSQGGTFDKVGIELTSPVFTHGQLYVAVSRTSDFPNVTIMTSNNDNTTKNIVFPAIFDKEYIDEQRRILLARKTGLAPRPSLPVRIETDSDFYTNQQSAIPASILHTSEDPADEQDDWSQNHIYTSQTDLRNDPSEALDSELTTTHMDPYSGLDVQQEDTLMFDD